MPFLFLFNPSMQTVPGPNPPTPAPAPSPRYRMLGRDVNSNPTQYRNWVVPNTPDFTASLYTGLKSGTNPFVDVTAYTISDGYAVADFSLPLADKWKPDEQELFNDFPIRKVLPDPIEDSHLAVIDGYAYMFGGKITDKIYRANLNNPADWVDTGAKMPSPIYGGSLAIIDGYIYIFGGNSDGYIDGYIDGYGDGYHHVDGYIEGALATIYSAPRSNPLQWTNMGALLPRRLFHSSLAAFNRTMYLLGGRDINGATDVILTANFSNPLLWSDTGAKLPAKVYGASLGQINNILYLFGGASSDNMPTSNIMGANVINPTFWAILGTLPYSISFCQFVTTGNTGYLIGPMVGSTFTGFTPIIQCSLSAPLTWVDRGQIVPGVISHSQMAVIYDRIWLFGGSGLSAIFACNQKLKLDYSNTMTTSYGFVTRTVFRSSDNLNNPSQSLGFPYWNTDYH